MAIITKELALRIVKKLKAEIIVRSNRPHDLAKVYEKDKVVATFGLRRGSSKNLGHDHIPEALYIRPREAKLLGQCPLSRDEWVAILAKKGLV